MKLYATTTSERARKGQGGNEVLNIVVRNEKQQCIAHINFYPDNQCYISILQELNTHFDNKCITIGTDDDSKDIKIDFPLKGNKQKTVKICEMCSDKATHFNGNLGWCNDCVKDNYNHHDNCICADCSAIS